ncbi:hypothetical protein PHISP_04285 [Aspergillus sp. HF37]|nr:hypothetical protein PHISP_04285 [Aspergillus sp. HF37]
MAGGVECSLVADALKCGSLDSQSRQSIPVDNVVCVVPDSQEQKPGTGYRVLYLQEHDAEQEPRLESVTVTSVPPALSAHLLRDTPRHLQNTAIHVVISTGSGIGRTKSTHHHTVHPLLAHLGLDTKYVLHETQSPHTITHLTRTSFLPAARAGTPQTIILLAGDGGLVDLVNVFHGSASAAATTPAPITPPDIVLIPTGTGNAMANSAGLLRSNSAPLTALARGSPRPIPAFAASFSPGARLVVDKGRARAPLVDDGDDDCRRSTRTEPGARGAVHGAVVASWGLHAALVAESDTAEYRRFGSDRFKMAAKELLYPSDDDGETHRYKGAVTLFKCHARTGERYAQSIPLDQHMYVLAALVSSLERDFVISPASLPLDGRLRMVHFGPVSPDEASRLLGLAYQGGRHVREPGVLYEEVEGFRVAFHEECEKWRRACVDGQIVAVEEGGYMEVHRDSRHLLNLVC